jgi:hypothetical protein
MRALPAFLLVANRAGGDLRSEGASVILPVLPTCWHPQRCPGRPPSLSCLIEDLLGQAIRHIHPSLSQDVEDWADRRDHSQIFGDEN